MPELPDVTVYVEALRERVLGTRLERIRLVNPFVLRSVDPPLGDVAGRTAAGPDRRGRLRLHHRHARHDRGGDEEARGDPSGAWRGRAGRARSRRAGAADGGSRGISRGAHGREPHAQARAHRPDDLLGHRQRVRRRDPASGAAVAGEADARAHRRRGQAPVRGDACDAHRLDRAPAPRGRRRLPRGRDRLPPRHGRARPLPPAVPRLRRARAAHRVRGERDQLLPALPDRRPAARRSRTLAPAQAGLAAHARRAGAPRGRPTRRRPTVSFRFVTQPEIRREARKILPLEVWNFGDGASETELTKRRNRQALDRLAIRQDILVDAREIDTTTALCSVPLSWPVVIAPMGGLVLFHDEGDVEMGRGAERADTLQFLSGATGWSVEAVAAASNGPKMFQL